jgi:hypothetical protein
LTRRGNVNPNFQIIKKSLNIMPGGSPPDQRGGPRRRAGLRHGAEGGQKVAECGEIVNYLKQQPTPRKT